MLGSGEREAKIARMGVERYRNRVAKGKHSKTPAAQFLLRESTAKVSVALEAWIKESNRTKAGRSATILPWIKKLPVELMSFLAVRAVLDRVHRRATYSALAHDIGKHLADEAQLRQFRDKGRAHLRKILLKYGPRGHQVVMKQVKECMAIMGLDWEPWPKEIRVKVGSRLIDLIIEETGIIAHDWVRTPKGHRINLIIPTQMFTDWLREAHEHHETMSPWHMPIPIPPAPWNGVYGGGYHTDFLPKHPVISTRRASLKHVDQLARVEMPDVYSALNRVQETGWELNPDTYYMLKHVWEAGIEIGGVPSRFEEALPVKPDDPEADKAYRMACKMVFDKRREDRGLRLHAAKVLFMAEELENEQFFYPHHMDFRGRMYPSAYFLQPQGPSFARALLRFSTGKPITDPEAIRWFKIHGANCYGKDKISFTDRIQWVTDNEGMVLSINKDPLDDQSWTEADKPWEFLAWCLEYGAWKENPGEFLSKLPVSMDGTTNGLQIFSLMLRDPIGAEATNCTPSDKPQDIYRRVADRVMELLREMSTKPLVEGEERQPYIGQWLRWLGEDGLPREAVKRQVMTVPYGSTKHACQDYLLEWFMEVAKTKPHPWRIDFYMPCVWLTNVIWDAIGDIVAGARGAMGWLQEVSRICTEQKKTISWTAPSGMMVLQDYREWKTKTIRTTMGDRVRSVASRGTTRRLSVYKMRNGISPNFVHSLDAAALVFTVNKSYDRGVRHFAMVHDSFGTLAADCPILAEDLREAYAAIFNENQLEAFRDEVLAQLEPGTELPPLPEQGSLDPNEVIRAPYFFA